MSDARSEQTMTAGPQQKPRVLHRLPGRLRIDLGAVASAGHKPIEEGLAQAAGIHRARLNPRTANLLVEFDCAQTSETDVLARCEAMADGRKPGGDDHSTGTDRVGTSLRRAHVTAPDLKSNPELARQMAVQLEELADVHFATADSARGEIVLEYADRHGSVGQLVAATARGRGDASDGDDGPDAGQMARIAEAVAELVFFAARRARGSECVSGLGMVSLAISGGLGLIEAVPSLRETLGRHLGESPTELCIESLEVVGFALSAGWVGLILSTVKAVHLVAKLRETRSSPSLQTPLQAPVFVNEAGGVAVCVLPQPAGA